jgi:hypothetical protein
MLYRRFYDDKTNMSPGRCSRVGVVTVLMSHDLAGLVTTGAVQVLARQDGQVAQVCSKLETESFTLLHLGGLINRPVQIVGG